MAHCRATRCARRTTRFGAFCNSHKSRVRRHGHPLQDGITLTALTPYLKRVRRRMEKNREAALWSVLERRWTELLAYCRSSIAEHEQGRPTQRDHRRACQELEKLAAHVQARDVLETVLAVYLMAGHDPRRFRSDKAFSFQLVRRIRGLSDVNVGTWHDHRTGRVKRVYRDLPPRTTTQLSGMLGEAFGAAGLKLASLERQEEEERRQAVNAFHAALSDVS